MLYPDVLTATIEAFNGANVRMAPYAVPPSSALYAQNIAYLPGQQGKRFGHSATVSQSDGGIPSFVDWYFLASGSALSLLAYYTPSIGIRTIATYGGSPTTVMSQTGAAGASIVPNGLRLYGAFYDSTGQKSSVSGQVFGHGVGADKLFAPPITNTPTAVENATGVCTQGMRRIGFLLTTRNGYTTALCPVNSSGVFTPISFTSTGSHNIQVTIPTSFPTYAQGGLVQIVMSTVANPSRYYAVPGASAIPFSSNVIIDVSITDNDLAATGTDVTAYQNLLTSSVSGTPPFYPVALIPYSSRMGYATLDQNGYPVVYFSEPNNYQYVTADQHGVYTSSQTLIVGGLEIRGVCYLFGLTSTWSSADNGGVPVTWVPPQLVDGSIGVPCQTCLFLNPAQGYAWVASMHGLYLFQGGMYAPLPINYNQIPDWQRINWGVPATIQIADDQHFKRVIVQAPLNSQIAAVTTGSGVYTITTTGTHLYITGQIATIDGVTGNQTITVTSPTTLTISTGAGAPTVGGYVRPLTATHQMVWDYTEGVSYDAVKYSLNAFGAYAPGSLAVVYNPATGVNEIWYGPVIAGSFIRQNLGTEATPYRDVDTTGAVPTAIAAIYQNGLVPGAQDYDSFAGPTATVKFFHGAHFKVTGAGSMSLLILGSDNVKQVVPALSPVPIQLRPGQEQLVRWFLMNEQQSIQMSNNALDEYFIVSLIRAYYTGAMPQRN